MIQRISKVHPLTGDPILPLAVIGGRLVWPILGASDGEGGSDSGSSGSSDGDGDGNDGDKDTGKDGGSEGRGKDGSDKDEDDEDEEGTVSASEFARLKKRMQAADKRASDAEKRAKSFEDKDKSELEKAQGDLKTTSEERDSLRSELKNMRLQVAFLSANDIQWHDPALALSEANLEDVMDDEGKVDSKALRASLKQVAKDKPFLVKKEAGDKDEGDEGDGETPPKDSSGSNVGSGRKGKQDAPSKDALRRKYPALASRG